MKCRTGHPDRPRRHDLPRGRRGPRHGHLLRLRLRRHHRWTRQNKQLHARRQDLPRGRLDLHRRLHRQHLRRRRSRRSTPPSAANSAASWAGPTSIARSGASAPTPTHPHDAAQAVRVRRRGHRPVPHRAYVLRGRPHHGHPRDDRAPRPSSSARRLLWPSSSRMQQGDFEAHLRGAWRAVR